MDYNGIGRERMKGLAHADFDVRSEMLDIIHDEAKVPAEATGIVIAQIEKYGWEGAYRYLHQIADLPHGNESPEWVRRTLLGDWDTWNEEDRMHPSSYLLDWLERAPLGWLSDNLGGLREELPSAAVSAFAPDWAGHVRRFLRHCDARMAADKLGEPRLRARLEEIIASSVGDDEWPEERTRELKALCEAGGGKGFFTQAELLEWIGKAPAEYGEDDVYTEAGYRACTALLLIGAAGLPFPVAPLVKLFEWDWDWMNELIAETLKKTMDEAAFTELLRLYPELEWHSRLYLSSVLEECRFGGFEEELQAAYRSEKDVLLKTQLASALVLHGTESGIAVARQHLRTHRDFRDCDSLRDALFCQEIVLGRETDATSRHLLRMREERKRLESLMNSDRVRDILSMQPPTLLDSLTDGKEAAPRLVLSAPQLAAAGRNDPCPCGSGKKYKKCCG